MTTRRVTTVSAILLTTAVLALAQQPRGGGGAGAPPAGNAPAGASRGAAAPAMTLTTTGWMDGAVIPNKFTQAAPMAVSPAPLAPWHAAHLALKSDAPVANIKLEKSMANAITAVVNFITFFIDCLLRDAEA